MKFNTITSLIVVMALFGCEIEDRIDKAADRCEDKIANVLEHVENACFTKEEILELVRSINSHEDTGRSNEVINDGE